MPRTIGWDPPCTPFTLSHVAPLGVTRNVLRSAVASGRVVPLVRGVFIAAEAMAADPEGLHLQRALAVQLRRPTAIASHRTDPVGVRSDRPFLAAYVSTPRGVRTIVGLRAAIEGPAPGRFRPPPAGPSVES